MTVTVFTIRFGIGWLVVWISGASARLARKMLSTA
jgi:hypothetical protein